MLNPLPNDALPSRQRRRRFSGPARIAIVMWVISILGALGIMFAAAVKAKAAVLEPVTVVIHPPATFMLGAVAMSATALMLAVVAVLLAANAHRPRGGI